MIGDAHVAQRLLRSAAARLFPGSSPGVRFRYFYKRRKHSIEMKLRGLRFAFLATFAFILTFAFSGFALADTLPPNVTIISPNQSFFGYNESIFLGIDVVDDVGVSECWYTLDNGASNVSLPLCQNTTFDAVPGSIALSVYANDTSNNVGFASTSFTVNLDPPSISLGTPSSAFFNTTGVSFVYTPTDQDLQSCSLWGNFTGAFALAQTNTTPASGSASSFLITLAEGAYLWGVYCNDSNGHGAFSENRTATIDTTAPSLSIQKPSGTYNSTSDIPLQYTASDNFGPIQCSYSVNKSAGGSSVSPTSFSTCSNTTFSVSTNDSYILYLTVQDGAGNTRADSSSFTVTSSSSSSSGSSSSSSSSSSGSGTNTGSTSGLDIDDISRVLLKRGQSEVVFAHVINSGDDDMDECFLSIEGSLASWALPSSNQSVPSNTNITFSLNITAPLDLFDANYTSTVKIDCGSQSASTELAIDIQRSFSIRVVGYVVSGKKILVNYSVEQFGQDDDAINLHYIFLDEQSTVVKEGDARAAGDHTKGLTYDILEIDLPSISGNSFSLVVQASSERDVMRITHPISITGTGAGLTGFSLFGELKLDKRKFGIGFLVLAPFVILFFAARWIRKYRLRISKRD